MEVNLLRLSEGKAAPDVEIREIMENWKPGVGGKSCKKLNDLSIKTAWASRRVAELDLRQGPTLTKSCPAISSAARRASHSTHTSPTLASCPGEETCRSFDI